MSAPVLEEKGAGGAVRRTLKWWLKHRGWTSVAPQLPRKLVIVAAPHTSNWDFPFALAVAADLGLSINFVGKDSLFRWPIGGVMRWLGGIPVDRSKRGDTVNQLVSAFASRDHMHLVIAPEGTRSAVQSWKSGFYHIALGAGVPIAIGTLDYGRKQGGILEVFQPTGNYEADLAHIQSVLANVTPRRPENTRAATPIKSAA